MMETELNQAQQINDKLNNHHGDNNSKTASPNQHILSSNTTSPSSPSSPVDTFQQLVDAIRFNKVDTVDRLVSANHELVRTTDANGRTPLYIAAEEHSSNEIKTILIQSSDASDISKLLHLSNIETLVNNTAKFSIDNYQLPTTQENVLHLASRCGDSQLVTLLLAKSPDSKDIVDSMERSPIILAAANGRMECIRLLVLAGADVNKVDCYSKTALHLAIDLNHDDIAGTIVNNNGNHTVLFHYKPHKEVNDVIEIGHGQENMMEIIGKLDRYGKIISEDDHHTHGNQGSTAPTTPQHNKNVEKRIELELSRAQKWCAMMKRWVPEGKRPSKVKERTIKGIPDRVRSQAWRLLAQSDISMKKQPKLFKELIDTPSKSELYIYLDVNRASRDYIFFREKYGYGQVALFDVLKAYSLFDQEIGYTQGMSSIAALLVMYLPEEEAFWTFERLMNKEEYAMRNLFVPGLIKLHEMIYVFDNIITKYFPNLGKHFNDINLGSVLFATKWFITGYLDSLPFYLILRIWDLIFSLGFNIVYSVALALFKVHEKQLYGKSFEECLNVFQQMGNMTINDDLFVSYVLKYKINPKRIEELENKYRSENPDKYVNLKSNNPVNDANTKKSKRKSRFSLRRK